MIKALYALIVMLPDVLRLIKTIQDNNVENGKKTRLKDDIKAIDKSFKDKDAKALNNVFNGE